MSEALMPDLQNSFIYKNWILGLENLSDCYIHHRCGPGIINSTWVNLASNYQMPAAVQTVSDLKILYRNICKGCHAHTTAEEAQVLRAVWKLFNT